MKNFELPELPVIDVGGKRKSQVLFSRDEVETIRREAIAKFVAHFRQPAESIGTAIRSATGEPVAMVFSMDEWNQIRAFDKALDAGQQKMVIDGTKIDKPAIGSVWKHRNGNIYTVLGFTNTETERHEKYPVTIYYMGPNGKVWSRPLCRWYSSMTFVREIPGLPSLNADLGDPIEAAIARLDILVRDRNSPNVDPAVGATELRVYKSSLSSMKKAQPISDVMMELADRLGSEADKVDGRAWAHILAYAPAIDLDAALKDIMTEVDRYRGSDHPTILMETEEKIRMLVRRLRPKAQVPDDFITHRESWRMALTLMQSHPGENTVNKQYWKHELSAFDRAYAELGEPEVTPEPSREEIVEFLRGDVATEANVQINGEFAYLDKVKLVRAALAYFRAGVEK